MSEPLRPAIIGKHPDYGDFIRHGLDPMVAEKLMRWMDTQLAKVKSAAGDDWEAFWDGAQACRFWLGREVLGATTIGVMLPSHDRVGRRYPLLAMVVGVEIAPPFQDPADDIMERIEHYLNHARGGGPGGAGALMAGLDVSDLPVEGPKPATVIWAHHPEGDLTQLLGRAAQADHALCATGRSYWWAPARGWRAAAWLGCDGLPGHEALTWLLGGEEATPQAEPAPLAYAPMDPAAYDAFDMPIAADPLPEIDAPPVPQVDADLSAWEDDDLPAPSGDTLPDIDLPDQLPPEDERAALMAQHGGHDDAAADLPEKDTT